MKTNVLRVATACAAAWLVAPAAFAFQEGGGTGVKKVHKYVIVVQDDDGEAKVEKLDGKLRAFWNGQELPPEQVQEHGGAVILLDGKHQLLRRLELPESSGQELYWLGGAPGARAFGLAGKAGGEWAEAFQALPGVAGSKRMRIGVSLERPGEPLAVHLGVKPEDCVMLADVLEDQPAAKAGLRRYDVVVELDGAKPVTEESLSTAIQGAKPGQVLRLRVKRGGEVKDVEVAPEVSEERVWQMDGDKLFWSTEGLPEGFGQFKVDDLLKAQDLDVKADLDFPETGWFRAGDDLLRYRMYGGGGGAEQPEPARDLEKSIAELEERLARIESMLEKLSKP